MSGANVRGSTRGDALVRRALPREECTLVGQYSFSGGSRLSVSLAFVKQDGTRVKNVGGENGSRGR